MTDYWIGAALLVILVLLVVFLPLFIDKKRGLAAQQLNTHLAKARIQELEKEKKRELLAKNDFDAAVEEVKASLVLESKQEVKATSISLMPIMLVTAFLLLGTGIFYAYVSNFDKVQRWTDVQGKMPELGKRIVLDADNTVTPEELVDFALGLRTKLRENPDDHIAWLLLGRVLASINDIEGALGAFAKAVKIKPDHSGLLMSYSQTLLMTNSQENLEKAISLLQRLLAMADDNLNALGLLAIANTRLGNTDSAIGNWQTLGEQLPANSPMLRTVEQQLAELTGTKTEVAVTVTIEEDLRSVLPDGGYLFVFLQNAETEMKIPAAVVKLPVADFTEPSSQFSVTLDKQSAMLPSFDIDSLNSARLIARISADEKVDIAPGELQGLKIIPIVKGIRSEHSIIINKELP